MKPTEHCDATSPATPSLAIGSPLRDKLDDHIRYAATLHEMLWDFGCLANHGNIGGDDDPSAPDSDTQKFFALVRALRTEVEGITRLVEAHHV